MRQKHRPLDLEGAEALAAEALAHIATEPRIILRFLGLTGLSVDRLRAEADSPAILTAVLSYLLEDESLLLAFTAMTGRDPARVREAHNLLTGERNDFA